MASSNRLNKILFFAVLAVLATIADIRSFEFLPGSYFSLAMSAILFITARLGVFPAIVALAAPRIIFPSPLGNPFPAVIFGTEVVFVGLLRRLRPKATLLALDAVFWPILGLPLFFFTYRLILGVSVEITVITLLKVWLAGLFNAQIADLAAGSRLADRILGGAVTKRPGFGGFLKGRLSAMILPVALFTLWAVVSSIRGEVENQLYARLLAGVERAGSVDRATGKSGTADTIITSLNADPFDPGGQYGKVADLGPEDAARRFLWRPGTYRIETGEALHPTDRWRASRFYANTQLRGTDVWYTVQFEPFFLRIYDSYVAALAITLAALYGIYGLIELVASSLERRTAKLIAAAVNLSEKIEADEEPDWPEADIEELAILTNAFRADARRLRKSFAELTSSRDNLDSAVKDRTKELETRSQEIRLLLARVEGERESERMRIARELHDELGQGLSGLGMALHHLQRRLGPLDARGTEKIADMRTTVAELIAGMRRLIANLRPEILDRIGLPEALARIAKENSSKNAEGPVVTFSSRVPEDFSPSEETRTAAYRIAQEATRNALRHSGSREISMSLEEDGGRLVLEVADSGKGFPEDSIPGEENRHSFGIIGMRERCLALGGEFMIVSIPKAGTTVRAIFPYCGEETRCER